MKSRYDELKQLLNNSCPKFYEVVDPTIRVHLIDKNLNEYYFINFNGNLGHVIIQYHHKYRQLFEVKEITLDELVKVEAEEYKNYKDKPLTIENLIYYHWIF